MSVAIPTRPLRKVAPHLRLRKFLIGLVTFSALLALWQLYVARADSILDLPTPLSTLRAAYEMTVDGELGEALASSFAVLAAGAIPASSSAC
jgi:ABC-type nitrate/sulfonate/bicarbonate transport system permease component